MADRIPVYREQESLEPVRNKDINLPRVADVGGVFHDLSRTVLATAEPYVREHAEQQAIRDAGVATIAKDASGNFVRANLTHGGGLVYAKAYHDALDRREAFLRSNDFDQQLTPLMVQYSRDPVGFSNAAAGLADAAIQSAPPQLRGFIESQATREVTERTRGLSIRLAEENHDNMVRGLSVQADTIRQQIVQLWTTADPSNAADVRQREAPLQAMLEDTYAGLEQLNVHPEQINAMRMGLVADLYQPQRRAAAFEQLRQSAPIYANLDSIEKLETVQAWDNGVETKDDFGGFTYQSLYELFPDPAARAMFMQNVGLKLADLREQQRIELASQQNKEETADQAISRISFEANGSGTGVPVSKDVYARTNTDFTDHYGPVPQLLLKPGGPEQVVGFFRQNGYSAIGTEKGLQGMVRSGDVVGAAEVIGNILESPRFNGQNAGQMWYDKVLPDDLKTAFRWTKSMLAEGFDPKTIAETFLAKAQGQVPSIDEVAKRFSGQKDDKGQPAGYGGLKTQIMRKVLGTDDIGLAATKGAWENHFDTLMTYNALLYDNPREALNATAEMVRQRLRKSEYFFGGIGDARLFHNGLNPNVLQGIIEHTPRFQEIAKYGSFTDRTTQGRPRIVMQRIDDTPWTDTFGAYRLTTFDKNGRANHNFIVSMDQIVAVHNRYQANVQAKRRQEALRNAPAEKWIKTSEGGKVRFALNPEWQRQQSEAAPSPLPSGNADRPSGVFGPGM